MGGEKEARQGYRARREVGKGVRGIILISDSLYHPYTNSYKSEGRGEGWARGSEEKNK